MTDNKETEPLLQSTETTHNIQGGAFVKTTQTCNTTSSGSRRTVVVEPAVCLYYLGFFPYIILTEQYVYHVIGKEYGSETNLPVQSKTQCDAANETTAEAALRATIQADASRWMMYLKMSMYIPQIIMVLILGSYSDRGGRKIVILLSIVGTCLNCLSNVIIIYLDLGIQYLILGGILQGLSGGGPALYSASSAYLVDTISLDERSFRITALNAVLGVSGSAAILGIGYWITYAGYLPPFWFISCVHIVNIFYVIFFIPESNHHNTSGSFNPLKDIKNAAMLYYKTDVTRRNWKLLLLLLTLGLVAMVAYGRDDVMALFMLNRPLCWSSVLIGYFTATWTLLSNIGGVIGVKLFKSCFTDGGMIFIAGVLSTAMLAFQIFVTNTFMMFVGPVLGMLGSMFLPLVRSVMSKTVGEDEQGALFAGLGCLESIMVLAGSSLFNTIYADTVQWFDRFVFIVTTGISLIILVLFWIYVKISGTHLLTKRRGRISPVETDEPQA